MDDEIAELRRLIEAHDEHRISDATFRARVESRVDAVEVVLAEQRANVARWRAAFASAVVGLLVAVASFTLGKL